MMTMLTVVMSLMKTSVVSIYSITWAWLCDSNIDCSDASVEDNCSKCRYHHPDLALCTTRSLICDGDVDYNDASDEKNCSKC